MGNRKLNIIKEGKSPSEKAMERTYNRAIQQGGVTQDFYSNTENIREISRKLNYDICNGKNTIRRNLLDFSEDFNNPIWTKTGVTLIPNFTTNPNGIINATKVSETNIANTDHRVIQGIQAISGNSYTASIYVRKYTTDVNERRYFSFQVSNGTDGLSRTSIIIDTLNGIVTDNVVINTASPPLSLSYNIVDLGTYLRVSISTVAVSTGNFALLVAPSNSATPTYSFGSPIYTGATNFYIVIWGAQLEQGSIATSYQQTNAGGYDNPTAPATFLYVPSSYGESKNFAQVQNKRNLLQWSEEINNVIWTKSVSGVVVNAVVAPDGNTTADKITENVTLDQQQVLETITVSVGTYTLSTYVKKADRDFVRLTMSDVGGSNNAGTIFDINTGTVSTSAVSNGTVSNSSSNIVDVGNGWYRCSLTTTIPFTSLQCRIHIRNINSFATYAGTAGFGIYIWGAQIETGAYATPYQKTVAAGDGIVDFNFTRATSATVTNKQGVIEDSCYNLIQRSEEFDNAYWLKQFSTISANAASDINGIISADALFETIANAPHEVAVNSSSIILGTTYTYSIYVKPNGRNIVSMNFNSGQFGSNNTFFDLTSGIVTSSTGVTSSSVVAATNGFYRLSITATAIVSSTANNCFIRPVLTGTTFSYVGDVTKGIYIRGAQLVQGSTPRPYLRTTNRLNVPRLDYSRGIEEPELLIEPQATNLNRWSGDLTNAVWDNKTNTVATTNTNLNPFGTLGSTYLTDNSTNGSHLVYQTLNTVSGQTYTTSFYVRKADDTWCQFFFDANRFTTVYANFNFDTGLFGNTGNGTWRAKQLINGYWLITVTATSISTATGCIGGPRATNNTDSSFGFQYAGTGRKYCDVAAIQTELGSTATTFIPTTTATVTRNAETSYVDLFNNAALNKTNFTLYWEGYLYDGSGTGMSFCLSDTTTAVSNTNQIGWYNLNTPFYNIGNTRTNGTSNTTNNSLNKFAIQYNNGIVDFYRNGVNIWSGQTVAVFDYRYLVLNSGGSTFTTDKIALFNRTLTSLECINLTT